MPLPASPLARWLLALAGCVVVVAVSTQISREMTLWGVVASVLLLAWLWQELKKPRPPAGPEGGSEDEKT